MGEKKKKTNSIRIVGGKKIRVKELRVKMKLQIYIYFRSNQLARIGGFAQNEQELVGYHSI